MNPDKLSVLVLLLTAIVGGCATPDQTSHETPHDWLASHGGIEHGPSQHRANTLAQALVAVCQGRHIETYILSNESLTAFSWPNGDLFLSRGLVNALTDAQLSAAIAHELGHLLTDGQLKSVVALNGASANLDIEERADALGTQLLQMHQIPTTAMITMLQTVRNAGHLSPASDRAIAHRITLLQTRESAQH